MQDFSIIGMGMYSSQIINLLLAGDLMAVKEIYEKTKIPKNKIYESLEKLQQEGIVGCEEGKPKKYFIVNEGLIWDRVSKKEEELDSLRRSLEDVRKKREKLNPSVFSVIDGSDEMHKLIEYSNMSIKHEILSCSNLKKMYYGCYRTLKDAIERGVRVRFIAPADAKKSVLKAYVDIGVEVRIYQASELFPKIGLLDYKYTRVTISDPDVKNKKHEKTIWANSRILYNIVKNHFDKIWDESVPF
ncbi:MAG: TrmB family transcriptional regulator [Candidatus Woesearchaeota archaeon]